MKKRITFRVLAAFLLVLAGLIALLAVPHLLTADPVYAGKPLSIWLSDTTESETYIPPPSLEKMLTLVDAQGSRAIGSYLQRNRIFTSAGYKAIYRGLPDALRLHLVDPLKAERMPINAAWMLTELKQRAAPAGKDLAAALSNPNTSSRVRELAARSLAQIGRDASYAIPALVRGLNDPVDIVRECAARALGLVGSQRNAAELKHAMDTNRNWVTVAFAEALYALNPGDSNYAAGILRECIQDSNAYSKVYGSTVLWKIAKDANSTVPVLMQVLADTNSVGIHQWDIMQLGE